MPSTAALAPPRPSRVGPHRVLLVVSDPAERARLAASVSAPRPVLVEEAGTLDEARVRLRSGVAPAAVVVDADLRDGSGAAYAGEIVRRRPDCGAVVVGCADDAYSLRRVLSTGVRALVVRTGAADQAGRQPGRALSGRELQVLALVAEGRSNAEIGTALGLSALTVKSHLARVARKIGTGDRAEMVAIAWRQGLIG